MDLLLGAGDLSAAGIPLKIFVASPCMHAPHAALGQFLEKFAKDDWIARLFAAAGLSLSMLQMMMLQPTALLSSGALCPWKDQAKRDMSLI